MQTLLLLGPQSRRGETRLRSDCNIDIPGSFAGTILAGRYRISDTTDWATFKAHDLALDQTVSVRGALLRSKGYDDIWRGKAQQLALVRNPNFLNVLDVVSEESCDFVISEHPRGKSVAELLRERSRFDVEDVLALMTPLAGALDLAASFACSPNLISARCLFTESKHWVVINSEERSLSEFPQVLVRMDVWELVKPEKNIASSRLISKVQKRGLKSLAVRQAALFTYELLGGNTQEETEAKRWFTPVKQLGKAGNSILYDGLQGLPRFKTGEGFFQKLESAIRSSPSEARKQYVSTLGIREHSTVHPDTHDGIRRSNRDTKRLVAGLLGVVLLTALLFAILLMSGTPTPDPAPERTSTPTPFSIPTLKPLESRVVEHQPDQFREGAISKEELSAIKKAIKTIPWSRNSDPKAAADEDYAAMVKECEKSSVHGLLTDLITEAVSNDYQPNNEAANGAYFAEINSNFENGVGTDRENQETH